MKAARRRRLLRLTVPLVLLVAIVVVAAVILTGKLIIPAISGKMYPLHYQQEVATVAQTYHVDAYLLTAVARTESGFNPEARSSAGAVGLMQLLPSTAKWVTGLSSWKGSTKPTLTDPQDSLELGACYLSYLLHTFGDTTTALAAYNAGQTNVHNWIKAAGGTDILKQSDIRFPETQAFVSRVQRYKALYEKAHPNAFPAEATQAPGET